MAATNACRLLLPLVAAACFLASCGGGISSGPATLTVQGSDTMEKMVRAWAAAYMKAHPQVTVNVPEGDTGSGIKDLIDGKINIAAASRDLSPEEDSAAHAKPVHLSRTMVAKDALAIIIGPKNAIASMTMDELKGIFTGDIKKWSQIKGQPEGVDDADIIVVGREASSGTADYLREHVLGNKPFGPNVKLMPSTEAVLDAVENQKEAVGFVGISQAREAGAKIKVLPIRLNDSSAVEAAQDTVSGSDYPLERPLYLYCNTASGETARSFVEFCQSADGQAIAREMGFLTIK